MAGDMIIERVSIFAPQGRAQQLGRAVASLVGPIQVQPGCLSCRLFRGWHDSDELFLEAKWATTDELIRHLQSETYKQLLLLMELSAMPPLLHFYTVQEVRGLELVESARHLSA